jgi:MSHA type pilus biogenesis protein MshL
MSIQREHPSLAPDQRKRAQGIARPARWLAAMSAVLFGGACASGGGAFQPRSSVQLQPVSPAVVSGAGAGTSTTSTGATGAGTTQAVGTSEAPAPPTLPQLPAQQPMLSAAPEKHLSLIDFQAGTSIASAVTEVGAKLGITVSIDPSVRGTLAEHTTLRNVTLDDALRALATNNGYEYQLQGNVLRVVPVRLESKTFHLDYVALQRVGTMSTVVQRRLSAGSSLVPTAGSATGLSATVPGAGVSAASGGDVLSAQSVADIWNEIRVALTGILESGEPIAGAEKATAAATQNTGGGFGSRAVSVPFADGSNLVISPVSGLIEVTAMPDKLVRVEDFINEFQASVLRQVLIEAKIVEVNLSNSYQFGIDWNVLSQSGKYGFSLQNNPSVTTTGNTGNVNFTLTGGQTQIGAVLTALSSQGDVSVLSNEQTTALNNQRAIFNVTTDEVFFAITRSPLLNANGSVATFQDQITPTEVSVGIVLDVLPQISGDNVLTMDIRPAVTSIEHVDSIVTSDGSKASAPAIARREGDTIARMRAGETMIIGGLMQKQVTHNTSGIPILKDLPLIGKMFTHVDNEETRSELVVFLTPTIIAGQPATGPPH